MRVKNNKGSDCLHTADRCPPPLPSFLPQTAIRESGRSLTMCHVARLVGVGVVAVLSCDVCAHSHRWICRKTRHTHREGSALPDCNNYRAGTAVHFVNSLCFCNTHYKQLVVKIQNVEEGE